MIRAVIKHLNSLWVYHNRTVIKCINIQSNNKIISNWFQYKGNEIECKTSTNMLPFILETKIKKIYDDEISKIRYSKYQIRQQELIEIRKYEFDRKIINDIKRNEYLTINAAKISQRKILDKQQDYISMNDIKI